ncbi:hypothetical protein BTA51_14570 [Hahella sp. CCB-MM4]|uniref:type I polyketide synthase n=1 Tax=Hahella sp. (strain CCB-MM4) TaxID=1926491 RepID=UPI000B9A2965|nr:type I polyketide synthase [Hahella sp. CCB-MM4]OZG72744.1 hypothetical protein BTA51_14570 [Hahella sp. CCB-MM4]
MRKNTVADLVLTLPEGRADEIALRFLDSRGQESTSFTFAGLRRHCLIVAENLDRLNITGSITLLALENQADFVVGFFGTMLAGMIPAPVAPLRHAKDKVGYGRLVSILRQGKAGCVVVEASQSEEVRAHLKAEGLPSVTVLSIESLRTGELDNIPLPKSYPSDIAYIQYTSGSTSEPKGVVLRHSSVITHMRQMQQVFALEERARVVGWLPMHHDMGLVGDLFIPLFEGGTGVYMTPRTFLQSPQLWLKAVTEYRANLSAAPTFAFEYCCRKVEPDASLDLSCWSKVCVGSETVSLQVLDRFCRTFASSGFERNAFLPVYGLAEATLLVAGGRHGLEGLDSKVVKRKESFKGDGSPQPKRALIPYALNDGIQVDIRNRESGMPEREGVEGDIWVSGPATTVGYLEELSPETSFPESPTIKTGDLGFIQNGFLYVTGRAKDTVIVRGVNYSSEDLEYAVGCGQDLLQSNDHCVCVSQISDAGESFYLFQEVQRHLPEESQERLIEQIKANLIDGFGITADNIVLVPRGTLPRTANYKLARRACLERYLRGEMKVLQSSEERGISTERHLPEASFLKTSKTQETVEADPVVVVGMACKFPGHVTDPESFWDLLISGKDAITEVPPERWDNNVFYDARPAVPGKVSTRWAGFVDGIDQFDPALFGVSAVEAPEIDPQQRMLLETSWRLIENAGWQKQQLAGSDTGVFIGISTNDYLYMKIKLSPGMNSFNAYSGLGNANSVAANRLSFFYDLKGPSMAVDTACSSSLTAFHLGARAILNGDCSQAIVGGVNAILSPGPTITLSQFNMMSPEGRCKTFDASADGYVRAEGCGLVMLKRQSAALRDGDAILAVVAASGVGQDGLSAGMTSPNGSAQDRLLRHCLKEAGLAAADISYVEAHGTGTPTGDPVEMEQISKIYGSSRSYGSTKEFEHSGKEVMPCDAPTDTCEDTCYVGAVKANIGHLEAGAGIASVIKSLLMLQKGMIPPQIHLHQLNPKIRLQESRLNIPTEPHKWLPRSGHRHLAISSFGFGGSLAHTILKQADKEAERRQPLPPDPFYYHQHPFVLSAVSPEALGRQAAHWEEWLNTAPDIAVRDLCYSQALGRTHMKYRTYFLVDSLPALKEKLHGYLQTDRCYLQTDKYHVQADRYPATGKPSQICFLFTGQGEHYLHMGRELYSRFPTFRQAFDRCARVLDNPDEGFTLAEMAFENDDTRHWNDIYMQPILFAVQYALGMLWQAAGVRPDVLLGHSLGEYAAACLAGCFEPEVGMHLLKRRAELTNSITNKGFMATIFTDHQQVRAVMDPDRVQIAAINSRHKTVISGEIEEMERLISHFESKGVEVYRLKTDQAFHSHLIDPILQDYRQWAEKFEFKRPTKQWLSSVRGDFMNSRPDADHWCDHLRHTVLFEDAVAKLDQNQDWAFLELGPGASTLAAVRENLPNCKGLLLRSLNIKKGDRTELFYFLDSLGKLYQSGMDIRWENLLYGRFCPELIPGQKFMHQSYWIKGFNAEALTAFAKAEDGQLSLGHKTASQPGHYKLDWVGDDSRLGLDADVFLKQNPDNWLIVAEPGRLTDRLLARLRKSQKRVYWIAVSTQSGIKIGKPDAVLPPEATVQDWASTIAVFENYRRQAGHREWKMIYLAQGQATSDALSAREIDTSVATVTGSLLSMLKAVKNNGLMLQLWVVCENSQNVFGDQICGNKSGGNNSDGNGGCNKIPELNLPLSTLWGFSKTLFLEHPEWRGGLIDIDRNESLDERVTGMLQKILKPSGEHSVALRGGRQFIQQIIPKKVAKGEPLKFRDDGAFLITGGLGGLGLESARWVVENGGRHVVLVSRSPLPDRKDWRSMSESEAYYEKVQRVLELERKGARVDVVSMDIRQEDSLSQLFEQYVIRGVIHAAGVNWFSKVMDTNREEFLRTLKIKTSSTWALHRLSRNCDLDCFILFSSVSALWGSVELSHYTAANHFMDMLSQYRKACGLLATCINWGPWADVGMSAKPHEVEVLQQLGFRLMPPQEALKAMSLEVVDGAPLSLVTEMDWDRFQTFTNFSLQPSLFAKVVTDSPSMVRSSEQGLARIMRSSPEKARSLIEEVVRMELRMVMLIDSINDVDSEQRFNFLGMDSLMAISFAAKLEEYFGCKLPNTLAYNYPHIKAVSDFLYSRVYLGEDPAEQEAATEEPASGKWFRTMKHAATEVSVTLYCFPYAGAGASVYAGWSEVFGDDIEIIAVNPPGREDWSDTAPLTSLDSLVEVLESEFSPPNREFIFFGHSLGALMAFALYQRLKKVGRKLPVRMVLSGAAVPGEKTQGNLHTLPTEAFVEEVAKYCINPPETIRAFEPLIRADIQMFEQFDNPGGRVDIPLAVVAGDQDSVVKTEDVKAWENLADGEFDYVCLPGGHDLVKQCPRELAAIILKGRQITRPVPATESVEE